MHEMDLMEIDINLVAQLFDNYCQIIYLDKIVLKYLEGIQKRNNNNNKITRFYLRIGQTHRALGFHKVRHNFINKNLFCNRLWIWLCPHY